MNKEENYAVIGARSDNGELDIHIMKGTCGEMTGLLSALIYSFASASPENWKAMRKCYRLVMREADPYKETKKRLISEGIYALLGAMTLIGAIWLLSMFAHAVWRLLV